MESFNQGGQAMKRISIICTAALSLAAVSCMVEHIETPSAKKTITFSATLDSPDTKTSLVDGKKVYWTEGDNIAVISDYDKTVVITEATSVSEANAEFTINEVEGTSYYYALYPASKAASFDGTYIKTTIPNLQKAVPGGFDNNLNLTAAKTSADDQYLSFKNLCALVKVTIPAGMTNVQAITLMSDECLTGEVKIKVDDFSLDRQTSTPPGYKEVTIASEDFSALVPGTYYAVIRPSTADVDHKFTVAITTTDGKVKSIGPGSAVKVASNDVLSFGEVSLANAQGFKITNAPTDYVSLVDTYQIQYELPAEETGTPSWGSRDGNSATVDADGVVTFINAGVVNIKATYGSVGFPVTFRVAPWYRDDANSTNWAIASSGATKSEVQKTVYDTYEDTYVTITSTTNGAGNIKRAGTWLSAEMSPLVAVRISDPLGNANVAKRTIILDCSSFTYDGISYSGGVGGTTKYEVCNKYQYTLGDDSIVLVYDLSNQTIKPGTGSPYSLPNKFIAKGDIQFKICDFKSDADAAVQDSYNFYWFRTYRSLDELKADLEAWKSKTGLDYNQTK
ncbi:MAG: hypothetical protein ACI3ZL_00130 [Candidatus Cryptobacteroides sp.]